MIMQDLVVCAWAKGGKWEVRNMLWPGHPAGELASFRAQC